MKKVLICFFIWSIINLGYSYAQMIKFELYLADNCADTIGRVEFYTLTKDSVTYYPKNNDGVVYLPDTGKYELSTIFDDETMNYTIENSGAIIDTIKSQTIQFCLEPTTRVAFSGYCCCGTPCDGKQVDYYTNGNKRVEGFFKEGLPIGKVKFYYPTGQLRFVEKYNKRGNLLKKMQYDIKGNLIKTK